VGARKVGPGEPGLPAFRSLSSQAWDPSGRRTWGKPPRWRAGAGSAVRARKNLRPCAQGRPRPLGASSPPPGPRSTCPGVRTYGWGWIRLGSPPALGASAFPFSVAQIKGPRQKPVGPGGVHCPLAGAGPPAGWATRAVPWAHHETPVPPPPPRPQQGRRGRENPKKHGGPFRNGEWAPPMRWSVTRLTAKHLGFPSSTHPVPGVNGGGSWALRPYKRAL